MVDRPLILLTNDDGVESPGLAAAVAAVADLGELLVAAPLTQQTGMGRGLAPLNDRTLRQVLIQSPNGPITGYGVSGSPSHAVVYGVLVLASEMAERMGRAKKQPDLVIAGINYGENLGSVVTASGTVGAALEAADLGVPALAVSLETDRSYHYVHGDGVDWSAAAAVTRALARRVLERNLPFDVDVLKIDVPCDATPDTPWRLTRQSRQPYYHSFPKPGPTREGYQVSLDYKVIVHPETLEPDSDVHAFLVDRLISVTPLSLDLTSRTDLGELHERLQPGSPR